MEALRRFLAILQADWRERSRAPRFWVVLGVAAALTWLCFPPASAHYVCVSLNFGLRGGYSSAWVGMIAALVMSSFVSLLGFYVVRGTLTRDLHTRVWQLLVATPMTRRTYLLAKACSHLVVLGVIAAAGLGVAFTAQMVRGEDRTIDLIELVKPMLVLALPSFALTALCAVWFDMVPWLRRTLGNVLYFLLWAVVMSLFIANMIPERNPGVRKAWTSDPAGMVMVARDVERQAPAFEGKPVQFSGMGVHVLKVPPGVVTWTHWEIRSIDLLGRALWLLLGLVGVLAAAPFLDRCAAHVGAAALEQQQSGRSLAWLSAALRPLLGFPLGVLIAAELHLVLRPRKALWWLLLAGLAVAQALVPLAALPVLIIVSWMLSLDTFARSVLRERDTATTALVFTAPGASSRVLSARWVMLFLLALLPTLPSLVRLAAAQPMAAGALLAVALSLATWGLALGALFRNARAFELLGCALAYVSVQGAAALHVGTDPRFTLTWHLILLPLGLTLLRVSWPRLQKG